MLYQKPKMEILIFEAEDVIRTSGDYHDPTNPGEEQSDASGSWLPPIN